MPPYRTIPSNEEPQKSPFKMFFKSLKGLLCLKLRIAVSLLRLLRSSSVKQTMYCLAGIVFRG
jgi:hypothetical protein